MPGGRRIRGSTAYEVVILINLSTYCMYLKLKPKLVKNRWSTQYTISRIAYLPSYFKPTILLAHVTALSCLNKRHKN